MISINSILWIASTIPVFIGAQQIGTNTPEIHPPLSVSKCSSSTGCLMESKSIVLDSNWRWLHKKDDYVNCYTGTTWDSTLCPPSDPATCSENCALDGADYKGIYGVTTSNTTTELQFVVGTNVGSRLYVMEVTIYFHIIVNNTYVLRAVSVG